MADPRVRVWSRVRVYSRVRAMYSLSCVFFYRQSRLPKSHDSHIVFICKSQKPGIISPIKLQVTASE